LTASELSFQKWDATGNDFVVVELDGRVLSEGDFTPLLARQLCDREHGVGADGVVLVQARAERSTARVVIWNSDGSQAEMCGNALRCVALLLARRGWSGQCLEIGPRMVEFEAMPSQDRASIRMGPLAAWPKQPLFASLPELDEILSGPGQLVSFGNPHYVVPCSEIPADWVERGEQAQQVAHRLLGTGGINCGFLKRQPEGDGRHLLRVFERGAGATRSCGSGACAASAVLEHSLGMAAPHHLELPGGVLEIGRQQSDFVLSGAAILEFTGQWSLTHES
jgi:diaminopimelate epimerase